MTRLKSVLVVLVAFSFHSLLVVATRVKQRSQSPCQDCGHGVTLKLRNFKNVLYVADVSIGGQTLPALYDTGASELFVLSMRCHNCPKGLAAYDRNLSSSFAPSQNPVEVHRFGSGAVLASQGFETVHVGRDGSSYSAEHVPFLEIMESRMAIWDDQAPFSAIVGMGYAGHAGKQALLPLLSMKCFALCLERGASAPGWLLLGESVNSFAHFTGAMKTIALADSSYWAAGLTDVHMPGIGTAGLCSPSCAAVVDSGTSVIAVPAEAADMITSLTSLVSSQCHDWSRLPTLHFQLGGVLLRLPPEAYVIRRPNSFVCSHSFVIINAGSPLGPVWILGVPFLRHYYTIFDRRAKKIHVAQSNPACSSPPHAFLNQTQHSSHEGETQQVPIEADLDKARLPAWASSLEFEIDIPSGGSAQ